MGQTSLGMGRTPTFIRAPQQGRARPRFAETIPNGTRVVYVRQIRSGDHVKPKTRGALRALGLRRIGHSNLLPDTPSTWGNIRQAEHRIEYDVLEFGPQHARKSASELHSSSGEDSMVFTSSDMEAAADAVLDDPNLDEDPVPREDREVGDGVSPYELDGGKGFEIAATSTESVFVERFDDVCAVTWPTTLTADRFMDAVEEILDLPTTSTPIRLYVSGDSDAHQVPHDELSGWLKEYGKGVEVVRVDADNIGLSIVWQRDLEHEDSFEGGVVATQFPTSKLEQIFRVTGTLSVEAASVRLADSTTKSIG